MAHFFHNKLAYDLSNYNYNLEFDKIFESVYDKYRIIIRPANEFVELLIRIETSIEIVIYLLEECEFLIKETFKIIFTLVIIKKEIDLVNRQLTIIFREIQDFFDSMTNIELNNQKAYEVYKDLSTRAYLDPGKQYLIPEYDRIIINEAVKNELPNLIEYLNEETDNNDKNLDLDFVQNEIHGTSVLQLFRMKNIFLYYNRLRDLHCEFSFLLIHIHLKDSLVKEKQAKMKKSKNKIEEPMVTENLLNILFDKVNALIHLVLTDDNQYREKYCRIHRERNVLIDAFRRKQQLQLEQLNNLQTIVRIISELYDKHDNLIGKLMKTTLAFNDVQSILDREWHLVRKAAGEHIVKNNDFAFNNTPKFMDYRSRQSLMVPK